MIVRSGSTSLLAALTALVMAGSGCQSPHSTAPTVVSVAQALQFKFDFDSADPDWRPGDSFVYAVTTCDGVRERRSYLCCRLQQAMPWPEGVPRNIRLTLALSDLFEDQGTDESHERKYILRSPMVPAGIQYRDARGRLRSGGPTGLPRAFLAKGLYEALETMYRLVPDTQDVHLARETLQTQAQRLEYATANADLISALLSIQFLLNQKRTFGLVMKITEDVLRPSLVQLLSQKMSLNYRQRAATADHLHDIVIGNQQMEALSFELDLHLGNGRLSTAVVYVVPPRPPFHLCAGVVRVEGTSTADDRRWYRVELVSAQRGTPPTVVGLDRGHGRASPSISAARKRTK